jgi:hypothetical protein
VAIDEAAVELRRERRDMLAQDQLPPQRERERDRQRQGERTLRKALEPGVVFFGVDRCL